MDRTKFFDHLRGNLFETGLNKTQVKGIEAVLDEWERRKLTDLRWLAYMLGTDYHETARTMWPIEEFGRGTGRKYSLPDPVTGHGYWGRGLVQLTWAANYKKMGALLNLPLYENPDLALDLDNSVQIMFEGMLRAESGVGDFTNKSLEDYFNDENEDWINARRIINGTDQAARIAAYAQEFYAGLVKATKPKQEVVLELEPAPTPKPEITPEDIAKALMKVSGGAEVHVIYRKEN